MHNKAPFTPVFYFNSQKLSACTLKYSGRHFTLYYSVKACLFKGLVRQLHPLVDGFSVSSVSELQRTRAETNKPIHFVSPLIRSAEINAVNQNASSISFNSLEQFTRFRQALAPHINIFLRINPEISFIEDKRYDPCRPHSKLGIPLSDLKNYLSQHKQININGLHFHNACQDLNAKNLAKVLNKIKHGLGEDFLKPLAVNLGGGYLHSDSYFSALQTLNKAYNNKIIIEPGCDLVNSAGYLVSSAADIFTRQGNTIAVLDASVNHLPEVFEYNFSPEVLDAAPPAGAQKHSVILAGASCLAGDVFGEYIFKKPLAIGSRVVFKNIGAYSLVKAHTFNGLQIPPIVMKAHNITQFLKNHRLTPSSPPQYNTAFAPLKELNTP